MLYINDYIFDEKRHIFYPKSISPQKLETIQLMESEDYEMLISKLENIDIDNLCFSKELPTNGGICLNYNCQLRCSYCSYASTEGSTLYFEDKDVLCFIDYLIRNARILELKKKTEESIKITITGGGEPTYDWEYFKHIITLIKKRCTDNNIKLYLDMTTNGMLNKQQCDFLINNIDSIMISFDGTPEIHNKNRRSPHCANTSSVTEETIKNITAAKKLDVTLRTTLWNEDILKLREMSDYIYSNFSNFSLWIILPTMASGRAVNKIKKDDRSYIDMNNFAQHYMDLVTYTSEKYQKDNIMTPLFSMDNAPLCCSSCYLIHPWLMPDKRIITCMESEVVQTTVGEIKDGKIEWFSNVHDSIMEKYRNKYKQCTNCFAFPFCRGGCPVKFINDEIFGTKHAEWECHMIKEYVKLSLEKLLINKEYDKLKLTEIDTCSAGAIYKLIF